MAATILLQIRPRYHCFGHIHEGHGVTTDGTTTFVNASTCNLQYKPVNEAIVFDVEKRPDDRADIEGK